MREIEILLTSKSGVNYIFTAAAEIIDVRGVVQGRYQVKLFDTKYNELIFKSNFNEEILVTYHNNSLKEYAYSLIEKFEEAVIGQITSFIDEESLE